MKMKKKTPLIQVPLEVQRHERMYPKYSKATIYRHAK